MIWFVVDDVLGFKIRHLDPPRLDVVSCVLFVLYLLDPLGFAVPVRSTGYKTFSAGPVEG